ncbi:zinc finger CCCH domain-containing protein 29-like [Bidens hawaiensis]|uniref:zinc finger CCCH domain-containing protein 29-like n=1 Tax=Bidens hawaiensis TaxID=980011 RepID=UPI00404ADC16
MIASLYGSNQILKHLIDNNNIDVNKTSATNGATALHRAATGGSPMSVEAAKLLIDNGADVSLPDANGNKPGDVIARGIKASIRKGLEMVLKGFVLEEVAPVRKEYPVDVSLPDINNELYGSAIPSPISVERSSTEMGLMSPSQNQSQSSGSMVLGSTPPMSPTISPVNGWQTKNHLTPPALQLSGSRLRTSFNARDMEMRSLQQHKQHMIDDFGSNVYSNRFGELTPTNLDDVFGSTQLQSNYSSSPIRKPANFAFDTSATVAQAVINSRSGAFSKQRSQSFIDRGAGAVGSPISQWGSPDGKVDWGFNGDMANKFRKSASFGLRNGLPMNVGHEPDVSWVNSLVKDVSSVGVGLYSSSEKPRYGGGDREKLPRWVEQCL